MIDLKFLGTGSAFNTSLGTNSAYFIRNSVFRGNTLNLIDCGDSTFGKLKELDVLNKIQRTNIFLTHLHPDHISSVSSLIFYLHYINKIKKDDIMIYVGSDNIKEALVSILTLQGVSIEMYIINSTAKYSEEELKMYGKDEYSDVCFGFIGTEHCAELESYGILFKDTVSKESIYYSGDSNKINVGMLRKVEKYYQDVSYAHYDGNMHLSFTNLIKQLSSSMEYLLKIKIMHIDNIAIYKLAEDYGLECVFVEKTINIYDKISETHNMVDIKTFSEFIKIKNILNNQKYGLAYCGTIILNDEYDTFSMVENALNFESFERMLKWNRKGGSITWN